MIHPVTHSPVRRYAIGISLVMLLIAVYFFTYYGYGISSDEWFLFDATESMARRGDLRINFERDAYPVHDAYDIAPPIADTEPLQPILATPIFLLAQALPAIGLAHTVWLFNILTTALTAGILYAYGLALGYRARVAAVVTTIFGLSTIAWPYSRTFFREPLFTLCALSSAYLMLRIRVSLAAQKRPVLLIILFAAAFAGALLSKEASLLLVPAIVVEALPMRRLTRRTALVLSLLVVLGVLLLLITLNLDTWLSISITRWNLSERIQQARGNLDDMSAGLRGYMFSPARSMWLFSPVLLLGFAGWRTLLTTGRGRQIFVPLAMIASFAAGYALVRGTETWYGGLSWGSRYMVPATPFAALWLLPVIETVLERGAAFWQRIAVGAVILLSTAVQLLAVAVPIHAYYDTLAAQTPAIIPWNEGAWSLRWSPLYVCFDRLGDLPFDVAWRFAVGPAWLLPVLASTLAILAGVWLVWWITHREAGLSRLALTASTLTAACGVTLFGGLYAIRQDPRYYGDFQPTVDLLSQLDAQLEPGDVIVLNTPKYAEFFMNYYKNSPVVHTLKYSPGQRYSPEQAPKIESVNPEVLIRSGNAALLNYLAQKYDRIWLVMDSSPFITWSVRPVEHYLVRHYYPVREIKGSDIARAVLFDTTSAPAATATAWPTYSVGAQFAATLRIAGFDIPGGTTRAAGDILPVSLLWETLTTPPQDYTVALFVMQGDQLIAQRDEFPVNHFEFTSTWQPGAMYRDNHGLALPETLAPGTYEVWLAVYWWEQPTDRLAVTAANGAEIGDHVRLTTITVE